MVVTDTDASEFLMLLVLDNTDYRWCVNVVGVVFNIRW